jgi:O-antigen ligase
MFGVLAIVVIAIIFNSYFMEAVREERAISGDTRIAAWQVNWRVTSEHLLFGTGPGGYAAYYMTFFPNEGMATHNTYIDVLAQSGLVGLILWLWFFGVTAWQGFQQVRRTWGRNDFYQALACALFAGTLACIMIMMFGDWLLPFAYTQTIAGFDYAIYSWIFMGMIVALRHIPLPEVPAVVQA